MVTLDSFPGNHGTQPLQNIEFLSSHDQSNQTTFGMNIQKAQVQRRLHPLSTSSMCHSRGERIFHRLS